MVGCRSCGATLTATDRFCPACGSPNTSTRFHPRFGPAPVEPPGPPVRPTEPPEGKPYCPRCWAVVRLANPFCGSCGMSLDEARARAEVARFGGVWTTPGPGQSRPYRPVERLTGTIRMICGGAVITALAIVVAAAVALSQERAMFQSLRADQAELATLAGRLQLVMLGLVVAIAMLFVRWTSRAYRNLTPLGVRGQRIPERWATVVWFVPFGNLVWPKEMIDDLYRASDPTAPVLSGGWRLRTVPLRLHLWWMSLIGGAVVLVAAQWALPAPSADTEVDVTALALVIAGHLLVAAASLLTALLVGEVADRQEARVEHLGRAERRPRRRQPPVTVRPGEPIESGEPVPVLVHVDSGSVFGRY